MEAAPFQDATILVVDDQLANVRVLERLLHQAGYRHVIPMTDPAAVLDQFDAARPDLVVLDLHMPGMDGYTLTAELRRRVAEGDFLPILVLTADANPEAMHLAMGTGANDFLTKPFDAVEVLLRTGNLLHIRALHRALRREKGLLEERVRERTRALEEAQVEILERLALVTEYRDDTTGHHTQRVGEVAGWLARALELPDEEVALIERAAPLHDVGKVGVPDRILLKPARLQDDEMECIKTHTVIAGKILAGSKFPVLQLAEQIATTHHERWDGTGYPSGLQREEIPLPGRIVAVADVYDALTHRRPYRDAWPEAAALEEIERQSGAHFDPQVVEAFFRVVHEGEDAPR